MFTSVLVANRGEIAVRIIKTLRKMGIRSVVLASIPDRRSLAVRSADDWQLLEGYSATESYLDIDAVVAAAKAKGCEAIHPGYGFLSERADFAERCAAEGLVFVGPPPDVLAGMGDKSAARRLAVANGVPVVPGWDGADDDETLLKAAGRIGFPVMVKARGGGGGRGMREVFDVSALPEAIGAARREAQSAFGDPGLLLEKLVTQAHHVEVQVLADAHGNVIHLGERDCSVQRRHQKLVEETPSPVVDDALRAALTGAALRLARAIGYVNAGTFEFLVGQPAGDGNRPFYFLEVNPRLQVEHPVTEMVTGLDLVELQLRIAAGEPLSLRQEDVRFSGHAIECRINAEDPSDGFKPGVGRIRALREGTGRFDSGFEAGDSIPSQYDSLLAKAVTHAPDRAGALTMAAHDLGNCAVAGIPTNIQLQRAIVASAAFRRGDAGVDWLEHELARLVDVSAAPPEAWVAAAVSLSVGTQSAPGSNPFTRNAWVGAEFPAVWLYDGSRTRLVRLKPERPASGKAQIDDVLVPYLAEGAGAFQTTVHVGAPAIVLSVNCQRVAYGDIVVREAGPLRFGSWTFTIVPPPPLPRRVHAVAEGVTAITAPLSGTIADVRVAEGDSVEVAQVLVTLEAMKMEHRVVAPNAGIVKTVAVRKGDVVREGDVLAELA